MGLIHTTSALKIVLHEDRHTKIALKKHFAKTCRSAPAARVSQKRQPHAPYNCTKIRHVSGRQAAFWTCTVLLGELSLPLLLDMGAAGSLKRRRRFTIRTDHQVLTTLLSASGSGHKPLCLHRWGEPLRQYDFKLKFPPRRDNVVADLLSRSITGPTPAVMMRSQNLFRYSDLFRVACMST